MALGVSKRRPRKDVVAVLYERATNGDGWPAPPAPCSSTSPAASPDRGSCPGWSIAWSARPSIIAVILNYVKHGEARGTWIESHFRWQIRTFWYGLLWVVLCGALVVLTLGLGVIVVWIPLALVTIWFIYRVARGWLRLAARQPMYK